LLGVTVVVRSKTRAVRRIEATHRFDIKPDY
jgi:hypothetical protein